ncbi:hypothetical protein IW261DRAFT_355717 [Armillaria novae-zelandiae]|uniref:Uncharacterized protein n=1 Tax=Armillaria novae-zelandiae TaxID=153914 RepID=A0AA39PQ94_9AGAR|nr:hypothetical protein IW261DRAFT_355717 [Armillaria novae-zelandiae]
MPFQWLIRPFYALLRCFTMPQENDPRMYVFSNTRVELDASLLLSYLKENRHFPEHGLRKIIVTKVDYCKCHPGKGSPWEHEFLLVTLKETVGAGRTAWLLVDRLMDDAMEYTGGLDEVLADRARHQSEEMVDMEPTESTGTISIAESESTSLPSAQQWATSSPSQRAGAKFKKISRGHPPNALDRLIILPNLDGNTVARELGNCLFDILLTMVLTKSKNHRSVPLEHFALLLRTTSKNTPQYHCIFAQCYWYAYTIWRILEIETQPRIVQHTPGMAERQCAYSGYGRKIVLGKGECVNSTRSPETIKAQWEAERLVEDEEWTKREQEVLEKNRRVDRAEEGRREAEARALELQRRVESLEHAAPSANTV